MSVVPPTSWCGQSIERVEDAALLTGRGRFIDDLGVKPGTLYGAILRSPHAHATITAIRTEAVRNSPGVAAVLVGKDITDLSASLVVGIKAPIECWPIAVDRVRYVGEPVAVVVAANRYLAEDALDLIEIDYEPLAAVVDPLDALEPTKPILHEGLRSNLASERLFRYGDPERAFAESARRASVTIRYPRNSCTPIETYGLVAEYDPAEDAYDVLANFMGPFSLHAVMARALKVPGNRFRLRTPPDSGGSFGIKQGVFPYIVLMGVAARACGRPVKWIEDRLEHLAASVSATNRVTTLQAAVDADGRVRALAWDQIEDVGAHIRAPEPATLYRMHGNLTGAYDIRNVSVRNRIVLTNKTPTGLNRGFGGPQVYYALERLMQRIAIELNLDPVDVIRKNLIPSGVPLQDRDRRHARFRRLRASLPNRAQRRRLRRIAPAAERRPRARPCLRHRSDRGSRAQRFQHGLHHHRADAGRAPQGRTEEWRAGHRDGGARSARRRLGPCCLGAAGSGSSHRAGADCR
jgi:2-furoyl-CoA dehydrogenase large subunit